MTSQKKSRKDAADKRLTTPLAYLRDDTWFGYVNEKGKPMFADKEGNPLSYSQLTPAQKLQKLEVDITCQKKLQPTTLENGKIHVPCERQRNRLLKLIDAEKAKKAAPKTETSKPVETVAKSDEKAAAEIKPEESRVDGKQHKAAKSGRRYM